MKRSISLLPTNRMCLRYGAVFVFSTFLATILLINITEVNRTETCDTVLDILNIRRNVKNYSLNNFDCSSEKNEDAITTLDLPYGRARTDNQRMIRIYDFIRVGNNWDGLLNEYDVCLTTQTSIERLNLVPEVLRAWNGPLSLAVLVVSELEWLTLSLYSLFLERCYPSFRNHVTIHLAVPVFAGPFYFDKEKLRSWNVSHLAREALQRDCKDTENYLNQLLERFSIPTVNEKDKLAMKIVYPQNHLRNIARKGCGTHWTFSTDVDIIPREGLAELLQEFYEYSRKIKNPCKKCAFVVPTFELDESKPFPKNKSDVIKYVRSGAARQYHEKDYVLAQRATDYPRWIKTKTRISHKLKKDRKSIIVYEPFYVSSDSIPAFDERFLGYGRTRSSQFQEALLAGWSFSVLTNAFSIHWGLHPPLRKQSHTVGEDIRNNQTVKNRHLFDKIFKEMKLKKKIGLYN